MRNLLIKIMNKNVLNRCCWLGLCWFKDSANQKDLLRHEFVHSNMIPPPGQGRVLLKSVIEIMVMLCQHDYIYIRERLGLRNAKRAQ